MNNHHPLLLKWLSIAMLGGLLAACDSSVGTSSNPDLSLLGGSSNSYTGPAARTVDTANFQQYLWRNVNDTSRCGGCHNSEASSVVTPMFFDTADVNVAYTAALSRVDLVNPVNSTFVQKLNSGHFCWEPVSGICATLLMGWIEDWKNAKNGGAAARLVNLSPPANIRDPGEAKSFPATATTVGTNATSFANTIHPILIGTATGITTDNCQGCHEEIAQPLPIAPFFANADVNGAFEAAKSKIDIDTPSNSRFVVRLGSEFHNCWTSNCGLDAARMQQAIQDFADGIATTPVDPTLISSKAITMSEGVIATGGNRFESNQFALWEFKTGTGLTAFDTSGVEPAVNLTLLGSVNWLGAFGLEFTGGRAQANTTDSDKLFSFIQDTGQFAIEAWLVPANVTQEDANIISYSGSDNARNFTLAQTLYNYEVYNRINAIPPAPNGDPFLTTGENNEEIAQSSLQHVVVNYDPFTGRSIYVNGSLVNVTDPVANPTSINNVWDDGFAFILGNETSGNRPWRGQVRMVALHSRVLTPAQIQQNFDLDVGEKFFLMFYIGHHLGEDISDPKSFIVFEVAQFDDYSYLFNRPTYVNLDPAWTPVAHDFEGLRIGINGKVASAGQAFASLDETIDGSYDPASGQLLSSFGTIIALEKGPGSDEFFLTFERLGTQSNAFVELQPGNPVDPTDPASPLESDIGVRTFEEINATLAAITGIPITNSEVQSTYDEYFRQLPTVESIDAFLPSHQMAVAQLALTFCSELVETNPGFFAGFNFATGAQTAFDTDGERDLIINPLLTATMNVDQGDPTNNLTSQPSNSEIVDMLGAPGVLSLDLDPALAGDAYSSLIAGMLVNGVDTTERTAQVVKAVCAATAGSAVMLVQ